jgi:hypothetical protein
VSDLTDEMRQVAADAAAHARPMAVAEVIRRGNHRRTRSIAQRSIGGLSAVGLGAAVLFTGVTHHPTSNPAAAGAAAGIQTVAVTQSSAGSRLSLQVKYRILAARKFKVVSVAYSGDFKKALMKRSVLFVFFGPGLNSEPRISIGYSVLLPANSHHHFSGSRSAKIVTEANKTNALGKNGSVSLFVESVAKPPSTSQTSHRGTSNGAARGVSPSKSVLESPPAIAILYS